MRELFSRLARRLLRSRYPFAEDPLEAHGYAREKRAHVARMLAKAYDTRDLEVEQQPRRRRDDDRGVIGFTLK